MPNHYIIRVLGQLVPEQWCAWFDDLRIEDLPGGQMQLSGPLVDQAALFALLNRIRDLGLTLVYLERCDHLQLARVCFTFGGKGKCTSAKISRPKGPLPGAQRWGGAMWQSHTGWGSSRISMV